MRPAPAERSAPIRARLRRGLPAMLAAALGLGLIVAPGARADRPVAPSGDPSTQHTPPAPMRIKPEGSRRLDYRGISVDVPANWPIIDLDADPNACPRLDVTAVYLGDATGQRSCPAHAIGRGDTLWLAPMTESDLAKSASRLRRDGLDLIVSDHADRSRRDVAVPSRGVTVHASWGPEGPQVLDSVVRSIRDNNAPSASPSSASPGGSSAPASPSASASPSAQETPSSAVSQPTGVVQLTSSTSVGAATTIPATLTSVPPQNSFTGMAFDTCAAPTTTAMAAWRNSPYSAVGIYIGGSMRACLDGNLSAAWLTTVAQQGWGLIPIYVGLQAPCAAQSGLATISTDSATAAAQGAAAASDAVTQANRFGLPPGSALYFDMEYYPSDYGVCSNAVLTFMHAWTTGLHAKGYRSGGYGNGNALMADMTRRLSAGPGFTAPDQIWFALWDGVQTLTSPDFPAWAWPTERMKQYRGDNAETWGGVTIHIDGNWASTTLPGNPILTNYGTNIVGPGSAGFRFTGSMFYWRPIPGQGLQGKAYWTGSSGSATEYNGATWAPTLTPGLYAVDAWIPASNNTGTAQYTLSDARGTTKVALSQSTTGYRRLGTVYAPSGGTVWVHLGDNDPTNAATNLVVDAMRFTPTTAAPEAPQKVRAYPLDGRATVIWDFSVDFGTPVTGYTVTTSPGGQTMTVPGTERSVVVPGLTNGQSYTFTVVATSAAGSSPASLPSNAVLPAVSTAPRWPLHDFSLDGRNDLLARDGSGNLWMYPGGGVGAFATQPRSLIGTWWQGETAIVGPGDVDGDGIPDVVSRDAAGRLWLSARDGLGGWKPRQLVGTWWQGMTAIVGVGDLNGDGLNDLLARDDTGGLWLYRGDGTGKFLPRLLIGSWWQGMTALVGIGDLNRDGTPDLLARDSAGDLWLYPGNGAGALGTRTKIGTWWQGMTALVGAGDVTGDGVPDVIARDGAGDLWLYPGDGAGRLGARSRIGVWWQGMTALL